MTPELIIAQIKSDLPKLKIEFSVTSIGLFGSYATRNVHAESDLDFLVELDPPYARNYFDLLFFLENKFGKKVDLIRRGSHLREKFIQHVEKDIIYA
ncbi:MAG: nucleotidyltransferase domain-containing protein [Chitinophagaceae bacterium]|nr:nucleotidyltransferase domain-containing protein [Chitinophagaceae bacterium]